MHEYLRQTLSAEQLAQGLRWWEWLDIDGLTPHAANMFGDLILHGRGKWWFLSTVEGTLRRPWNSWEECEAELRTEDGMQDYLGAGLVDLTRQAELNLKPHKVIGFSVPPVLGGGFELDNLRAVDFLVVHLFMGKVHEQTRALPLRAKVSDLMIDDRLTTADEPPAADAPLPVSIQ